MADAQKRVRQIYFSEAAGFAEADVYDRYVLEAGHRINGPPVVEEMDSNILIHPGFDAEVDEFGNLLIGAATSRESQPVQVSASKEPSR